MLFFFGSFRLIVLAGIVAVLRQPKPLASGPLSLPDGSVLRILAVTCGTNHVVGRPLARRVARMPAAVQAGLVRLLGNRAAAPFSTTTSEPKPVIWLGRATNNATTPPGSGYYSAFLVDASGFTSGDSASVYGWWSNPQQMQFRVIPRRDPAISVNFFHHDSTSGVSRCGSLPFANPLYGVFPQWKAGTLPATRRVGDVAVTLEKVSTGHDQNTGYHGARNSRSMIEFGTNRSDGQNKTVCFVQFWPLTDTNQTWLAASEEASDATCKKTSNTTLGWGSLEEGFFSFEPGVWPSESAGGCGAKSSAPRGLIQAKPSSFATSPSAVWT